MEPKLDHIDLEILARLMRDGRATWADLAVDFDLTAPGVANRVRRLQERGVIRHFAAWVDSSVVAPVAAFISVSPGEPEGHERLLNLVRQADSIPECHAVAGEGEYVLKIRCASLTEVEQILAEVRRRGGNGTTARTSVVLTSIKESPVLPISDSRPRERNSSDDEHA